MKEQRVVITDNADVINKELNGGVWKIVSTTAQNVSVGDVSVILKGSFCFVIEKV